jgi:tetratricopeptide (TPR) repeat protein
MTRVVLMENHDEAYFVWRDAGTKDRILVHVDAHHDMWWIAENSSITIANFICPALREKMVREVFWVVPDQTWDLPRSRKSLFLHLMEITKSYPDSTKAIEVGKKSVSAVVLGKPLTICSVDELPEIHEDVLLDIDVDYLMIPFVSHGQSDKHGALPWCWPEELLVRLGQRGIRSDLATVSYSVEGGYTPLKWKYLGDELGARLRGADPAGPLLRGMALVHAGAKATVDQDFDLAEIRFREGAEIMPDVAAPHYHLSQLYLDADRVAKAKIHYRRAVTIDPSYRTALDTAGVLYQSNGAYRRVEQRIQRAMQLDPEDSYAHFGLGRIAAGRKEWTAAETCLQQALALDAHLIDAHRALGHVLTKQGRYDEAIRAYESSMKLALAGHKPIMGPIITNQSEDHRVMDPHHCRTYAQLAYLHARKGETARAIAGYRFSIAGGYDPLSVRTRLAYLYAQQRQWKGVAEQIWLTARSTPKELRRAVLRSGRKLRRFVRRTSNAVIASGLHRKNTG